MLIVQKIANLFDVLCAFLDYEFVYKSNVLVCKRFPFFMGVEVDSLRKLSSLITSLSPWHNMQPNLMSPRTRTRTRTQLPRGNVFNEHYTITALHTVCGLINAFNQKWGPLFTIVTIATMRLESLEKKFKCGWCTWPILYFNFYFDYLQYLHL